MAFIPQGKTEKAHQVTINLKYLHQHGMRNLNYQMDLIPYQIFLVILSTFKKNMGKAKAGNKEGSLLNEIRQIVYCLHQSKQITKQVYNNIIN